MKGKKFFAIAGYFGFAPVLYLFPCFRKDPFLRFHLRKGILVTSILSFTSIFYMINSIILSLIAVNVYGSFKPVVIYMDIRDYILIGGLIAWLAAVTVSIILCRDYGKDIYDKALSRGKPLFVSAYTADILFSVTILFSLFVLIHSALIYAPPQDKVHVYCLYDDFGGGVPEWSARCLFYPLIAASNSKFGAGSVLVAPITRQSLDQAFTRGKFVFLAMHGENGSFLVYGANFIFNYTQAEWYGGNSNLQYIYFSACQMGYLKEEWEKTFAPSKIKLFARDSAMLEHFLWIWTEGPGIIASLK